MVRKRSAKLKMVKKKHCLCDALLTKDLSLTFLLKVFRCYFFDVLIVNQMLSLRFILVGKFYCLSYFNCLVVSHYNYIFFELLLS